MWHYELTLQPGGTVFGPVDRKQLLQLIRSGVNPRIYSHNPPTFTVRPVKVVISIEPVLTEVHAGFFVTMRAEDGNFIRNSRLFRDRWEAEAYAHDLEISE